MVVDARTLEADAVIQCDLCIIGAGPAGLAIAHRLQHAGLHIVLVEAGGLDQTVSGQRRLRGSMVGHPTYPLHTSRFQVFGGSGNRWGGWSRPLECADFNDWPVSAEAIAEYYKDTAKFLGLATAKFLGLATADFDLSTWSDRLPPPLSVTGSAFTNVLFQISPVRDFGRQVGGPLLTAKSITTLLNAVVVDIRLAEGTDRVDTVKLHGGASVRCRAAVLAAGAIENARLLLASTSDRACGLGNERDQVGRYFMEHPHVLAGHLALTDPEWARDFYRERTYGSAGIRGMLATTRAAQEHYELPAAMIGVEPLIFKYQQPFMKVGPQVTVWPERAHRRLLHDTRTEGAAKPIRSGVRTMVYAHRRVPRRAAMAAVAAARREGLPVGGLRSLYVRAEQPPRADSRVTLGRARDGFGMPVVQLDWRLADSDLDSISGWLEVLDQTVRQRRLGQVIAAQPGWRAQVLGGPHHLGTTRMSSSPADGVVDGSGKVHTVANLYVAGSSTFRTGGYANPTFTLVALAFRLADELRSKLAGPLY